MQLIINTYGAYLQKNGDCFKLKTNEGVFEISYKKVSSILISTAGCISTDAVKMAVENDIDIVFIDKHGNPYGRIWHPRLGSTARIRRKQLGISGTEQGFRLALQWVRTKFKNQMGLLNRLKEAQPSKSPSIASSIKKLRAIARGLDALSGTIEEKRNALMGLEGKGTSIYFAALNSLMPEEFRFKSRSRNPAKDHFNAFLNYAYGVLYSKVERACIVAGLDPYVGFIHADHYNKKSLVFDLMENYRIWAEEVVMDLFIEGKVKQEHCDRVPGGWVLNKEGKALLLEALFNFMEETINYRGRNIRRNIVIQFDCHRLAQRLLKGDQE